MVRPRLLDVKVVRDAVHLRGQLLAVAALVACGTAVFVMLRSMNGYLRDGQQTYYAEYGFGEVFAHATRAPRLVADAMALVPGVDRVDPRVVKDVLLDVPDLPEPATGRLVSLPDDASPSLNRLVLRSGDLPSPGRRDQVVVSAAFAAANALRVGDTFGAVLNGRSLRLTVVGTAISPEFIYEISGFGDVFPDNRRFGAMWMSESAMSAAFEMEGAFNDVVATLTTDGSEREVIDAFDELLEPYGGTGAYGREGQVSHEFVTSEIDETKVTASFFPALFLLVTAFLLHTTMLRLVQMEREQIGLLKAFGFARATVASHYVKIALLPVSLGALVGTGFGVWLAGWMAEIYGRFFQFPDIDFQLNPNVVWAALAIAIVTGVTGALAAVQKVVKLAPAVAMAPPNPPRFRRGWLEANPAWRALAVTGRMIARNVTRARWRSFTTGAGMALALGVLITLLSMFDAIDTIRDLQFDQVSREDIAVYFDGPRPAEAVAELGRLPGVMVAEPVRFVSARLVHGHRERRLSLMGVEPGTAMRRIVDARSRVHRLPVDGMLVSRWIADRLGVERGSTVRVEVTEGRRPTADITVAGVVDELMGGQAYIESGVLNRMLREPPSVSGAWLQVDDAVRTDLYGRLKRLPGVASVVVKDAVVAGFEETIRESFRIALDFSLMLGVGLVMAIIYNQARVALSERGRELASLRVLGFSRREVGRMLLGEQAVIATVSLPFGLLLGWALTALAMQRFSSEVFRLPVVALPRTYAFAAGLVVVAAAVAGLLVRRRLDRIDLIGVLKTRE